MVAFLFANNVGNCILLKTQEKLLQRHDANRAFCLENG